MRSSGDSASSADCVRTSSQNASSTACASLPRSVGRNAGHGILEGDAAEAQFDGCAERTGRLQFEQARAAPDHLVRGKCRQ